MDNIKHRVVGRDIEVDLRDDIAAGSYANIAIISHSPKEFVLDFASMLPGMAKPRVTNRVVITPEHAKSLLVSLQENVKKYESQFGNITSSHQPQASQEILPVTNNKIGEA